MMTINDDDDDDEHIDNERGWSVTRQGSSRTLRPHGRWAAPPGPKAWAASLTFPRTRHPNFRRKCIGTSSKWTWTTSGYVASGDTWVAAACCYMESLRYPLILRWDPPTITTSSLKAGPTWYVVYLVSGFPPKEIHLCIKKRLHIPPVFQKILNIKIIFSFSLKDEYRDRASAEKMQLCLHPAQLKVRTDWGFFL